MKVDDVDYLHELVVSSQWQRSSKIWRGGGPCEFDEVECCIVADSDLLVTVRSACSPDHEMIYCTDWQVRPFHTLRHQVQDWVAGRIAERAMFSKRRPDGDRRWSGKLFGVIPASGSLSKNFGTLQFEYNRESVSRSAYHDCTLCSSAPGLYYRVLPLPSQAAIQALARA